MKRPADLVVRHADTLATCAGPAPRQGARQRDAGVLRQASIAAHRGVIVFVGSDAECDSRILKTVDAVEVDARGCTVVPGFVDAHTHVVFAGDRLDELALRLGGATYGDIAARGGGILSTVRGTRAASEAMLAAEARPRLQAMLANGTTTCEAKSGYGLSTESELRMLRVMSRLNEAGPIEIIPTFMGAHEFPPEFRDDRRAYVRLLVDEMLPAVADAGLAAWCDVFCEHGVFAPDESCEVLEAGLALGLGARVHADELGDSGGAEVAARVGARSADHLVCVTPRGIERLAEAGVVATLLPAAAFFLKLGRFAPARALIAAQVPVALGTDINPGGGFSPSMPFVMAMACFAMQLTLEEALVAATLNAAYSLGVDERVGSLEPGKQMDIVLIEGPLARLLEVGTSPVRAVLKRGRLAYERPDARGPGAAPDAPHGIEESRGVEPTTSRSKRQG